MDVWTEQSLSPYTIYIKKGKKRVLFFLIADPLLMCFYVLFILKMGLKNVTN